MGKKTLTLGEWRPDVALLETEFASEVNNVISGVNSYEPFPSLMAFTAQSLASGGNDSFVKVMLHMDGADAATAFTDSNQPGLAHVWTAAGNAQIDTADSKFGGASGLFDGAGDWVTSVDSADYSLGSGDFTIDCWVKPATSAALLYIAGQGNNALSAATTSFYLSRTAANKIEAGVSDGASFTTITGASTTVVLGSWYHVALVRSGNVLTLYLNGASEGTAAFSGTVNNSANDFRVGAGGEVATTPWNGWIDEFRVSVGTARWTAAFDAPGVAYFIGGTAVGLTAARTAAGAWKIYGGTATRLFSLGSGGWTDVTRAAGVYSVSTGDLWQFEQSGTKLIAVHPNDDPQVIDVDSGTQFAALAGTPPRARSVRQIGDFLVLSGLTASNRSIQWSASNDITGWTAGLNLSDIQVFPDGGQVQGVAGAEIGYVVQDRAIRTMQFLPGDVVNVFSFSRVMDRRGCISHYGYVTVANVLYFVAEDGFFAMAGHQVFTIGDDKVNRWFRDNSDTGHWDQIQAFAWSHRPFVSWAYRKSSASQSYDMLITYDWTVNHQRWTKAEVSAQIWGSLATTGLDLDTTGAEPGDVSADSTALSLDSFAYIGGRPVVSAIDTSGYLGALTGAPLAATVETAEGHLIAGMRAYVSEAYPLIDAANVTVTMGTRERLQDSIEWGSPVTLEVTGSASVLSSSRLHRARLATTAGDTWTHAMGVQLEVYPDGVA